MDVLTEGTIVAFLGAATTLILGVRGSFDYLCSEMDRLLTPSLAPSKAPRFVASLLSPILTRLQRLRHRMVLLQDKEELLLAHLVYSKSAPPDSASEEGTLDAWLQDICSHFSHSVVSLLVDSESSKGYEITSRGVKARGLEAIIKARAQQKGALRTAELNDLRTLPAHDLLSFGVCHELLVPIAWRDQRERERKGVLWIGYSREEFPSPYDIKTAELFVRKLERDATLLQTFSVLNGQIEEAKSQSERKSEFLRHFSHDIRSPLNNIRSVLHVLKDESTSQNEELLEVGISNCSRLEGLVQDILDYSRHQAGVLVAEPVNVNVGTILEEVVQEFKFACRTKGLVLSLKNFSGTVFADKGQVRRIVTNLVSNAVKYTAEGSVTLSAREDGDCIAIWVEDTGRGMSEEEQKRLFIPFSRFDRSGQEGTGLGLVVSRALADLNGGRIEVRSSEGRGSVFTLVLPKGKESSKREEPSYGREILLFDDDADLLFSLGRALSKEGFKVHVASTVERARSLLQAHEVSLVLSDLNTGDGGFLELKKAIATIGKNPPIFVLTGAPDDARAVGVQRDFILEKPVDIPTLLRKFA